MKSHAVWSAVLLGSLCLSPRVEAEVTPMHPAPIAWTTCERSIARSVAPILSVRLQCGTMQAPVDHLDPDGPSMEIGLMRVLAEDQQRVAGAFFFNFGGPGGNPREILPVISAMWTRQDENDAVSGYEKTLSTYYDLVAVVPRGLSGGDPLDCFEQFQSAPFADIAADLSDYNWHTAAEDARSLAYACTASPLAPYINTEQHVYDMELARLSLGESTLNFIGYSYGSWVGTWYGAMFPDHVGRMLLDSAMDVTRNFADADELTVAERHRDFVRLALRPALGQPRLYGLGRDEEKVLERIRAMPSRAKVAWSRRMRTPDDLAAVMAMADWVAATPLLTLTELQRRAEGHEFTAHAETNRSVRAAAVRLAAYYTGDGAEEDDPLGPDPTRYSVSLAVRCNDTAWHTSADYWRQVARVNASRYPAGSSNEAYLALVCASWDRSRTRRPSLEPLHGAPPFLIVQAQYDAATPLEGATQVFNTYANANLVVARNLMGHAILGQTQTPCVEEAAGRYLLTGELPAHRFTSCEQIPARGSRDDKPVDPLSVDGLRAQLGTLLKHS